MPLGGPVRAPSFDELLLRLAMAEVSFILIGGLVLRSWGVIRGTRDCYIVPDLGDLDELGAAQPGPSRDAGVGPDDVHPA
jgi:hypothetical protein